IFRLKSEGDNNQNPRPSIRPCISSRFHRSTGDFDWYVKPFCKNSRMELAKIQRFPNDKHLFNPFRLFLFKKLGNCLRAILIPDNELKEILHTLFKVNRTSIIRIDKTEIP